MYLDKPVNQNGSHLSIDLNLIGNVGGLHMEFSLLSHIW